MWLFGVQVLMKTQYFLFVPCSWQDKNHTFLIHFNFRKYFRWLSFKKLNKNKKGYKSNENSYKLQLSYLLLLKSG